MYVCTYVERRRPEGSNNKSTKQIFHIIYVHYILRQQILVMLSLVRNLK